MPKHIDGSRRDFLRTAVVATGSAVAATSLPLDSWAWVETAAPRPKNGDQALKELMTGSGKVEILT